MFHRKLFSTATSVTLHISGPKRNIDAVCGNRFLISVYTTIFHLRVRSSSVESSLTSKQRIQRKGEVQVVFNWIEFDADRSPTFSAFKLHRSIEMEGSTRICSSYYWCRTTSHHSTKHNSYCCQYKLQVQCSSATKPSPFAVVTKDDPNVAASISIPNSYGETWNIAWFWHSRGEPSTSRCKRVDKWQL